MPLIDGPGRGEGLSAGPLRPLDSGGQPGDGQIVLSCHSNGRAIDEKLAFAGAGSSEQLDLEVTRDEH